MLERSTWVQKILERAAYYLAVHDEATQEARQFRQLAKDARANPDTWIADTDLHFDEYAASWESDADKAMLHYLEFINDKLLVFAPPRQRSKFRAEAIARAEKLARDRRWLEEYRTTLERS
jgi:protein involved in temperature-dependent protein secretion